MARGAPAIMAVLRERGYDGWISLDFNAVDMLPGVTIEQDITPTVATSSRRCRHDGEVGLA